MLSVYGRAARTCAGITRREWLRAGGLGATGLSLSQMRDLRAAAPKTTPAAAGFGRAKSCILLFMFGAPAHQDTFDMKPHAADSVRGEFQPIDTCIPGIQICEHLPQLARRANQFAQIRSVTHADNTHTIAMHYMLTGVRHRLPATNPQNAPDDFPCFGAAVNYVHQHLRAGSWKLPAISLNAPANQVSANNHIFPGFFAGSLGNHYDPIFISQHASEAEFRPLPAETGPLELLERRTLLRQLDLNARLLEASAGVQDFSACHEQAFSLLTDPATRGAFDIAREPRSVRDRYGMTPFGQGCLLSRRLVEAGVSLVTVNWERDDAYWDTHSNNFKLHRNPLLPNLDRGFSALLDDLDSRGLLDETLIVWLAEFGRTPRINANAGRDHWAACQTVLIAGAGIAGGQIYGESDAMAAFPSRDPVSPEDLAATIYHLLGIAPSTTLHARDMRSMTLSHGSPIVGIL